MDTQEREKDVSAPVQGFMWSNTGILAMGRVPVKAPESGDSEQAVAA